MLSRLRIKGFSTPAERREALTFYILISPWLIGFLIFIAYPMLRSLYLSFTSYDLMSPPVWIGLRNYERIFNDPDFWQSLKVTALFVLGRRSGWNHNRISIGYGALAESARGECLADNFLHAVHPQQYRGSHPVVVYLPTRRGVV